MHSDQEETVRKETVVLIADDDEFCLDVAVKMLQKLSYTVLKAKNGQEAIEIYQKNQNKVDLVILDMQMPENGGQTFGRLKKINSKAKILIISGYANDHRIRELLQHGCKGFMQKPFSMAVLSKNITKALNNSSMEH
jgi:CheY-like chemotaxis protein